MGATTVVIPDVELVKVGTWDASTGKTTVTTADLESMVAAAADRLIDQPPVKLGHTDKRFSIAGDGEPAMGWVTNLRVTPDGKSLRGDLTGVPSKLAEIMRSAYPRRSVEIGWGMRTVGGKVHRAVLTGLALLGIQKPAVKGLDDLLALYSEVDQIEATSIVEFAAAADDTPTIPPAPNTSPDGGGSSTPTNEGGAAVTVASKIRENLGLAADATDEQVEAALTKQAEDKAAADKEAADKKAADDAAAAAKAEEDAKIAALAAGDTVTLTTAQFQELLQGAQAGRSALAAQETDRRDRIVQTAFSQGRIHRNDLTKYRDLLDKDEAAVTSLLSGLTPIFPVTEIGSDAALFAAGDSGDLSDDDYKAAAAAFGLGV